MKNFKALLVLIMVFAVALALTACGKKTTTVAGGQTTTAGGAGEATTTAGEEKVDMTAGVYNCKMGSYELLMKFYDETTVYFQSEQVGYRATYKIVDEEITYARTQADGSTYNSADHGEEAKWLTSNKTIYFYEADGTTPFNYTFNASETGEHSETIVAGTTYKAGTPANALAYDAENDMIISFKGGYGSRTLSHTSLRSFSINDEKAIEQAKFMVATLPETAEKGQTESSFFLTLSQKGYETNIPALEALDLSNGKFTTTDNVTYNLTDTITGATAVLTVTDNGATVVAGETTVTLVVWEEVAVFIAQATGSAYGGRINVKIRLMEDGSVVVFGSTENYTGTYKADKEGNITFNIPATCPVAITSGAYATEGDVTTVTIECAVATGQGDPVAVTATGAVNGTLYGSGTVSLLTVSSNEAVYADNKLVLEFVSNATFQISVGGTAKVTGMFSVNAATRQIEFKKVSTGELAFTLGSPAKITWTGRLSDVETEDKVYTFEFEASALGALMTAQAESVLDVTATVAKLGNKELTLSFIADGTLKISANGSDLATATWAFSMNGAVPQVTFDNVSNGTITGALGQSYTVTWAGTIVAGENTVGVEVAFEFPSSELANLR